MTTTRLFTTSVLGCALWMPLAANASDINCDINFNHDLIVSENSLEVRDEGKVLYRFDGHNLLVDGKTVDLSSQQYNSMVAFQSQFYDQMPATMAVIEEALAVAGVAVDAVVEHLSQMDIDMSMLEGFMDELSQSITEHIQQDDGSYRLVSGDFDNFGVGYEGELEQQIEAAVSQSIGSIMMQMGSAMVNGEGETFASQMEAFGERMETMSAQIEQEVAQRERSLEQDANQLCMNWQELDKLEQEMQKQIPELKAFDLIQSSDNELAYRWMW